LTGGRNKTTGRQNGGLHGASQIVGSGISVAAPFNLVGSKVGDIRDGLSKTIAIAEDVGRNENMPGAYNDFIETGVKKHFHRWAEPDNGFGVSGNPTSWADQTTGATVAGQPLIAINNNLSPFGGPTACPWQSKTNCGPNDEIFSFHGNGANVVFMDGHVSFLSSTLHPIVLRRLVTATEGVPIGQAVTGSVYPGGGVDY
jgi:prepilin-type processing-associated H-X9-DG protein